MDAMAPQRSILYARSFFLLEFRAVHLAPPRCLIVSRLRLKSRLAIAPEKQDQPEGVTQDTADQAGFWRDIASVMVQDAKTGRTGNEMVNNAAKRRSAEFPSHG